MPSQPPSVAIVEDDKHMGLIWQRKLTRSGFNVVGVYASARAAWQALRKNPPKAIILDWELVPGPNGDWLLKQCIKHKLPTRILVVTCHDYGKVQTAALGLGAHGFLGKPVPLAELVLRLTEMLQGKVPLSTHNGELFKQQLVQSPCAAWEKLSPQQQRIVALAAEGKGNKEIGTAMQRSKGTIEEQKRRTFAKLGTRDIKRVIALCAEALRPVALSIASLPCPLALAA